MYGEIGAGGQCWGQSWNAAVGEITVFMVVKQFSMLGLEILTILTKKMTSFFFFYKYFQFATSTSPGRGGTACLSTNNKSEDALSC